MHEFHTPQTPEIASPLTRRAMLLGSVAVSTAVSLPVMAAAAEAGDNYDELAMLIDHRDELIAQHLTVSRNFEAIDYMQDQPDKYPKTDLLTLFGEDHVKQYYPTWYNKCFDMENDMAALHSFYELQIELAVNRVTMKPVECHEWPFVKIQDYEAAIADLRKKYYARQLWEDRSGYLDAEADLNRVLDELCHIEQRIYAMPVLSFRDLQLKLSIVKNDIVALGTENTWLLDDDDLHLVLMSLSDFANSNGRPSHRPARVAEAGA